MALLSPARRPALLTNRPVVDDRFNRVDNATSLGRAETGQAWSATAGTWGIASGRAYVAVTSGGDDFAIVNSGLSDCEVKWTIAVHGAAEAARPVFRYVDTINWFHVRHDGTTWILGRDVAGLYTTPATWIGAAANGDVIKTYLQGSSIRVFINGVERLSVTDTNFQTATRHGLHGSNSTLARFDDFSVRRL